MVKLTLSNTSIHMKNANPLKIGNQPYYNDNL